MHDSRRPLMHIAVLVTAACCSALAVQVNAGEERTPTEWLAAICAQSTAERASETPERTALLESAGRTLHAHGGGLVARSALTGSKRQPFEPFLSWYDRSETTLFPKWLRGEALSPREKADEALLNAVCFSLYRAVRQKERTKAPLTGDEAAIAERVKQVELAGQKALTKGYLGQGLSEADLEALRLYAIWIDIRLTGNGLLPNHLGLTQTFPRGAPPPGTPAPEATLLRSEAPLRSAQYSDENPANPADLLRPSVVTEFLLLMQGYEPDPAAPDRRVRSRPVVFPDARPDEIVRLSSFRGKKPVLLVFADPTDVWAWHWKLAPALEPLHQAYRQHIEFFFVATTVHDTHMPVCDFLGAQPGRHDAVHPLTLEQRARVCKMFQMYLPHSTVPYLLDDMAQRTRDAYRDQGGGAYFVLIDANGVVAHADYHQDIPPHWGPKGLRFPYEYLTVRLNHLDARLKAFADGGYHYHKGMATPCPPWRLAPERRHNIQEHTIWLSGRIVALDVAAGIVTVQRDKLDLAAMRGWKYWQESGATPFEPRTEARLATVRRWVAADASDRMYRFQLSESTDLFLHGQAAVLEDLRLGDRVGVRYPTREEGSPLLHPIQVRAHRVK